MAVHCNRRGVWTDAPRASFSPAVCTFNYMHITLHGSRRAAQRVCVRASFHLHVIHDVCLSVRCLSLRVCPSPVSLCCLPLLFHTPPVLFPASSLPRSTCTLPSPSSPMSTTPREITATILPQSSPTQRR